MARRPKARSLAPEAPAEETADTIDLETGAGALVVTNMDPNAPVTVRCAGVRFRLRPGFAYPLPLKDITDLQMGDGKWVTRRDKSGRILDGTRQIGWYWNPEAAPLTPQEMETISMAREHASRAPFAAVERRIAKEYGERKFAEVWAEGAKKPDEHGHPKGRAGSIEEVKWLYDQIQDPNKVEVNWDAHDPTLPNKVKPVQTDRLAVVRHSGEIVGTYAEKARQEEYLERTRARPPRHTNEPRGLTTYNLEGDRFIAAGASEGPL